MGKAIFDWSTTAASNASADTSINWAEGQSAASVNNSARALMARVAAFVLGLGAALTVGGSSNAYTITSASGHAVTSYAAGMIVALRANFTNTGAATLNYDGVGAVAIKKGGATALDAGDFVSGAIYLLVYDGTYWQVVGMLGSGAFQPLDSTLTAFAAQTTGADLIWYWTGTDAGATTTLSSFGRTLIDDADAATARTTLGLGTAAVKNTGTSGNNIALLDGTNTWSGVQTGVSSTASSAAIVSRNNADTNSNNVFALVSARATPTNGDIAYIPFYQNNITPSLVEFARIAVEATTVTPAGSEVGEIRMYVRFGGALTQKLQVNNTAIRPSSNDGMSVGTATLSFADFYLASGGVIGWNNGTFTLTQNGANLTASGTITARDPTSSDTGGTLTTASVNACVQLATAPTIPSSTFAAGDQMLLINTTGSSMTCTQGGGGTQRKAGTATTGNLTIPAYGVCPVYFKSATEWFVGGVS